MRRPLFIVCLCLVIAIAIGRKPAGTDPGKEGVLPPDGSPVRITGRIDTRTSEAIILSTISIIQNDQKYSYSGKLQCELTNVKYVKNVKTDLWETIPETVENYGQSDSAAQAADNNALQGRSRETGEEAGKQALKIGQIVMIEGTFSNFTSATNPGEFDVKSYYQGKGIGGKVKNAGIIAVGKDYDFFREMLYSCRLRLHDRLAKVFPAKEASIMQTLLLGEKEELDAEVKALYQKNGIAHILSISGLHITLLGMGLFRLLKRMGAPVRVAAAGGAVILLMYGMMVGMSVSASRAIGMYLLQMLGVFVGRTYDMLTGVGLLAVILVLQEPERLGDVSFLMSFGAVLGICMLTPAFGGSEDESNTGKEVEGQKYVKMQEGRKCRRIRCKLPTWLRTVWDFLGDSAYERNKYREGFGKVLYEQSHRALEAAKSGFAASVGVILFTLPVQLWFFYEIPVYSVLLNLLVLSFMSIVMAGGLVALIPGLGIAGTVDCLILWWYEWICERFEELPGAIWCVGRPEAWQIGVYYAGLLGWIIVRNHVTEIGKWIEKVKGNCNIRRKEVIQTANQAFPNEIKEENPVNNFWHGLQTSVRNKNVRTCIYLIALLFLLTGKFDCHSCVTFLDVGQGDGIVVETAQGAYLFDCGSTSRKKIGEYVLKPYLKSRGISSLRGVFVSHPDEDHMNGVLELLENGKDWGIAVEQLFLPAIVESKREEAFGKLLDAAENAGTGVNYIKCGDEIRERQIRLLCLHPEANTTLADANAYSECFYLEMSGIKPLSLRQKMWRGLLAFRTFEVEKSAGGFPESGFRILLTGDVEGEGERQLVQELKEMQEESQRYSCHGVDLLKVAHHGSGYSTSSEFLEIVDPAVAIISCGRNNSYGHPHAATLHRLEEVAVPWYGTMDYGAMTVTVDSYGVWRLRGYIEGK